MMMMMAMMMIVMMMMMVMMMTGVAKAWRMLKHIDIGVVADDVNK